MAIWLLLAVVAQCSLAAAESGDAQLPVPQSELRPAVQPQAADPSQQAEAPAISAEPIPYKRESQSTVSGMGKAFLILAALAAAGITVLLLFKKRLLGAGLIPAEKGKHIVIMDRQQLHGDNAVYYLAIDEKQYVLCVGNGHSSLSKIE